MTKIIHLGCASRETKGIYISEIDSEGKLVVKNGHPASCTQLIELSEHQGAGEPCVD